MKHSLKNTAPEALGESWVVAGLGPRVLPKNFSDEMLYFRAEDGAPVELTGHVTIGRPEPDSKSVSGIMQPNAVGETAAGWKAIGNKQAVSVDGAMSAELMELVGVQRRSAPRWLTSALNDARAQFSKNPAGLSFYEILNKNGFVTAPGAGQWGTYDSREWTYRRAEAKPMGDAAVKLFAIRCSPTDSDASPSNISAVGLLDMCEALAPRACFVSIRKKSLTKSDNKIDIELELEAGRIPPTEWLPEGATTEPATFEIASGSYADGTQQLVVPANRRSGIAKIHLVIDRNAGGVVKVNVIDKDRRKYVLPIETY